MGKENLRLEDEVKYTGEALDGLPHGEGAMTAPDGAKYVGEWNDDNPWSGTEYDEDGNDIATYSEGIHTEK
jgi:hypothetical protein